MKKLLSILASIGLVATASTAVVACTSQGLLNNATVDDDGNVTFQIKSLRMADDYDSVNKVNAHYEIFDNDGNHVVNSKITPTGKDAGVTSFKEDKAYSFEAKFKIDNYSADKKYTFKFGTAGRDNKMAKLLGTIKIDKGSATVTPISPDGTVSQSFKATIKGTTDSKTLATLFAIKDKDGNPIQGDYSFKPDTNKAYVLAADTPVSGTVTVKFTPTGSGTETFTIDESDAAKKSGAVTGFTPVKVTVDVPSKSDSANTFIYSGTIENVKVSGNAGIANQGSISSVNAINSFFTASDSTGKSIDGSKIRYQFVNPNTTDQMKPASDGSYVGDLNFEVEGTTAQDKNLNKITLSATNAAKDKILSDLTTSGKDVKTKLVTLDYTPINVKVPAAKANGDPNDISFKKIFAAMTQDEARAVYNSLYVADNAPLAVGTDAIKALNDKNAAGKLSCGPWMTDMTINKDNFWDENAEYDSSNANKVTRLPHGWNDVTPSLNKTFSIGLYSAKPTSTDPNGDPNNHSGVMIDNNMAKHPWYWISFTFEK